VKEQRKTRGVRALLAGSADLFCTDTAVLRGTRGVSVFGCQRILHYAPERICLCIGKHRLSVRGKELICTSFSAGCVSVEGEVRGILYCKDACRGCTEGEEI